MKKAILVALSITLLYGCGATKVPTVAEKVMVKASLDLVNIEDDKVKVTVDPSPITSDEVAFYIPKTVPGTYSTDNYGKYIDGFIAYDYQGNTLPINKLDENTWMISNAKQLDKVSYAVNDTYDTEGEVEDAVFSPAGTNIVAGETYMLNLHGFVGYFDDLKEVPYQLSCIVPSGLKATTSLAYDSSVTGEEGKDVFLAKRYFEVIDSPILYAKPNTERFLINDITVNLSVYSPNGVYSALSLKDRMEKMMRAQKTFLGNVNSTKEYNILLYLSTLQPDDARGFGALEHHTSTVVVLPEQMSKERLEQAMVDVVSHEFFHIVTPLNVHSEEVQFFDFNDPKMSAHLWMYEGTTEYFANLFQIQQGLIDEAEFFDRIMGKIANANSFDDAMSFTEMSTNILEEPFAANYANVYEKGTLINMALDLSLLEMSSGEKDVLWLMKELSKKYGKDIPFKDDQLIDEIVAMTYPEIRGFFDSHVSGKTPIKYEDFFAKVGLTTKEVEKQSGYFLNGEVPFIEVDQQADNSIFIRKGITLNSFFNALGAQGGDAIKSIDGTAITLETIRPIIGASFAWSPEKEISMVVQRGEEELTLTGAVGTPMLMVKTIAPVKNANEAQTRLRQIWLQGE